MQIAKAIHAGNLSIHPSDTLLRLIIQVMATCIDNFAVPMKLILYLGSQMVDYLPLDLAMVTIPGYLKFKTEELKEKNSDLLAASIQSPVYLVGQLQQINSLVCSLPTLSRQIA